MGAVIRTSALPKLASCPCFMGKGGSAGPYAARGTLADEAFRLANMGERLFKCKCGHAFDKCNHRGNLRAECPQCSLSFKAREPEKIDPLDVLDARIEAIADEHGIPFKPARKGVEWALEKMQELAGEGVECITDEAELTVDVEGLDADSVADGNAPDALVGFDLKTGKVSNYLEQMAGYALGFMAANFADRYTMHLLFCDAQEVVTHAFTYDEARNIVLGIRAKVLDPDRKPVVNQHCSWCALNETCTPRLEAAQRALEYANGLNVREGIGEILGSPSKLSAFLDACDALKGFENVAQNRARWKLEEGEELHGWALTRVLGIGHVTPAAAKMHTKKLPKGQELTLEKLFDALGPLTPFQFKNIMKAVEKPLPKRWRSKGRPSTYLMRAPKKKKI